MLSFTASIYSILSPLISVFEAVLKFFHNSVGVPWGWSIVLLTVCVRACLVPLTMKQMGSMARMQKLQPELKALQAKYKEDKQRQQQEMMKFYKENNVNPLGSCLPLVAQLPVFISLYYMLRESLRNDICPTVQSAYQQHYAAVHHISVKAASGQTVACGSHGASFLFIGDLTNKATGATLVILILLYVGTQLGSSLMMSSATMDRTQRQIMLFMPLIFVLFVIQFPAGVLVYWITTNIWTIGQQYIIKRRIGPTQAAPAAAGAGSLPVAPSSPSRTTGARAKPAPRSEAREAETVKDGSNGTAASGLGRLIGKARAPAGKEPVAAAAARPTGPPPKPPRKKKKRSGRRR
ncbi:MAG TPA: YidC/Oxa1 family membrane protein insertase [Solirubrobacteraceae bacterium]|jgi:YidC/Oxa1 family membrane protein insertase|nr:YidC/Oxa1 family membrane protein insertase [Solirubrobacteraceae bacterium]